MGAVEPSHPDTMRREAYFRKGVWPNGSLSPKPFPCHGPRTISHPVVKPVFSEIQRDGRDGVFGVAEFETYEDKKLAIRKLDTPVQSALTACLDVGYSLDLNICWQPNRQESLPKC